MPFKTPDMVLIKFKTISGVFCVRISVYRVSFTFFLSTVLLLKLSLSFSIYHAHTREAINKITERG